MKEIFKSKAIENIKIAEIAYDNDCFNASANRAYYAAFHAAIYALSSIGIELRIDHKTVQSLFAVNFINRRKTFSSKFKGYLKELQEKRNIADYKLTDISKKMAKQQLEKAKEFIDIILKGIK